MQQNVVAFQIPTQILFGVGALERVVEQVKIEDRPKVLIATDQGVKKAGLLDIVLAENVHPSRYQPLRVISPFGLFGWRADI
jgi:alcohol dehydrogenase YqhD (iron-dependent ADH family)